MYQERYQVVISQPITIFYFSCFFIFVKFMVYKIQFVFSNPKLFKCSHYVLRY